MATDFQAALAAEISGLEAAMLADTRYVRLRELKRVAELYGMSPSNALSPQSHATVLVQRQRTIAPAVRERGGSRKDALAAAETFVRQQGRVVSTREIFDHLTSINIAIGGRSPKNNLSAMISQAPQFVSHGRLGWTVLENAAQQLDHEIERAQETQEEEARLALE